MNLQFSNAAELGGVILAMDTRSRSAVLDLIEKVLDKFTGSVTNHFQGGIVQQVEEHTRRRLTKESST